MTRNKQENYECDVLIVEANSGGKIWELTLLRQNIQTSSFMYHKYKCKFKYKYNLRLWEKWNWAGEGVECLSWETPTIEIITLLLLKISIVPPENVHKQ